MAIYPYRKSNQIEKYIGQFMRIFAGFQVRDGVERNGSYLTKRVPVVYGNMSRIVASVLSKRDHTTNVRVPLMAVNLAGLSLDPENKRNQHHKDVRHLGDYSGYQKGVVVERLYGPAFLMSMELSVYASSTTELFEIVEQVLLVFNPRVTIQKSSDELNSEYITDVTLESLQPEIQYPMGTDQQIVMLTMNFSVPIRISYPHGTTDGVVEQIIANVKDGSGETRIENMLTGDVLTGDIEINGRIIE